MIGTGVVIDPGALVAEIETLAKAGIEVKGRLHHQQSRAPDLSRITANSTKPPRPRAAQIKSAPPHAASAPPTKTRWPAVACASAICSIPHRFVRKPRA